MIKSSVFLRILALAVFTFAIIFMNKGQPRIFILHSYNTDYTWVRQMNQGILQILSQHNSYHVRWHYMDTKNHPDISFKQRAGILARRQIAEFSPDILLACDDDAQAYVAQFYVDHPKIKIVFAGINAQESDYGFNEAQNVTGILERPPFVATRDFIPLLLPHKAPQDIKLIHLGDASDTVKNDEKSLTHFDWSPLNLVDSIMVETFDAWKKAVLNSQKRADCLYITNYRKLFDPSVNRFATAQEVMSWTIKHSQRPIIGGNAFVVDDGALVAVATSPYEQGRVAMVMAADLIKGNPVASIPIVSTKEFLIVMREGIPYPLPAIYESFARSMGSFIENTS